jgi:hypothetical protein
MDGAFVFRRLEASSDTIFGIAMTMLADSDEVGH